MSHLTKNQPTSRTTSISARFTVLILVATALAGCGVQSKATETRNLNATYVNGESLRVTTTNGRVEVIVDVSRLDISIEAQVTGAARTYEEALNYLSEIAVIVDHAEGNVLDISVDYGPSGRKNGDGCSFIIKIPSANGVAIDTKNGTIKITDTTGAAILTTSNGSVTILRHAGPLNVRTSNGTVKAEQVSGKVDVVTSNGGITYVSTRDATETFSLVSSNGTIRVTIPISLGGVVNARTSNGTIKLGGAATPEAVSGGKKDRMIVLNGEVDHESTVRTSNGTITIDIED